ncbi:hypothetical protein COY52_10395 [Candidatus Desantisbacteria bacterium CG_4_10_14_0_8_um_filter_48_22]|uniref:DUF5678 domain-containing protein n=1 Tax=Candidatus Desantisbacteria bacterium CG_4_10_14_0_8_um_filter_48_22 TaxID=1974543 RepID=A0A2M7S724_9BACT|nr:MAG: hypothetical protein COS16_01720 [Candidatus Desantisbacteria bacterium CG02_land_8_20_14_3_00_49_13]PIZ15133.1 MAG: hypothetical protein COY52_10395 [Candidatus Desantisbacteria bacterium CG_4_10_14_0_8_um_filter_48_22]
MYKTKFSNDEYFRKNFTELVNKYGGLWIAIAGGKKVMVGPKHMLSEMFKKARKKFPGDTPLISPIPKKEEIQCIL